MTPSIADFCADLPIATFDAGDALMVEGETSGRLYVLIDGAVEISKGGFQINLVSDRGAILGEMSVLLDTPHTATVRAVTACSAYESKGGESFLKGRPEATYMLAQILAQRLQGVTGYLVDLKRQFKDESNHLVSWTRYSRASFTSSGGPSHRDRTGTRARRHPGRQRRQFRHGALQRCVEPDDLGPGQGEPGRLPRLRVHYDVCRRRPDLLAGIEHPGRADAIDPGAAALERRLVDMA